MLFIQLYNETGHELYVHNSGINSGMKDPGGKYMYIYEDSLLRAE